MPKKATKKTKKKAVQRAFKPTEKIDHYNDYYGAKTRSERELNLVTGNDRGMYNYVIKHKQSLLKKAKANHAATVRDIVSHGDYPASHYGISARNIRKKYLHDVIAGIDE